MKLILMTVSKTRPRVSNWNNQERLLSSRNRFLPRPGEAWSDRTGTALLQINCGDNDGEKRAYRWTSWRCERQWDRWNGSGRSGPPEMGRSARLAVTAHQRPYRRAARSDLRTERWSLQLQQKQTFSHRDSCASRQRRAESTSNAASVVCDPPLTVTPPLDH